MPSTVHSCIANNRPQQQAQSRINHIKTARLTHRNAEQVALSSSIIRTLRRRPHILRVSSCISSITVRALEPCYHPSTLSLTLSRPSVSSLCIEPLRCSPNTASVVLACRHQTPQLTATTIIPCPRAHNLSHSLHLPPDLLISNAARIDIVSERT